MIGGMRECYENRRITCYGWDPVGLRRRRDLKAENAKRGSGKRSA